MAEFKSHMPEARALALEAAQAGEVPVGALVLDRDGRVIGRGANRTRRDCDPSAHAEVIAIREACAALATDRLEGCDLWVTLEPCAACAGVIAAARIARLYFGAFDPKSGGVEQGAQVFAHAQTHHRPEIYGGIEEAACAELLQSFFADRRGG